MADLAGSIFAGLLALYTGDTGAGGLNENSDSSSARVRHFIRRGDPNFDDVRTHNWPMIVVDIHINEVRSFNNRHADALARLHLYTHRDSNVSSTGVSFFTVQDAVNTRIFTVFDGGNNAGIVMGTQSSFAFASMVMLRHFQAPATGTELHYVHELAIRPTL